MAVTNMGEPSVPAQGPQQVHVVWPDDYVAVGPGGASATAGGDGQDLAKPVLFRPQVTVNVFNSAGPGAATPPATATTTGDDSSEAAKSPAAAAADLVRQVAALESRVEAQSAELQRAVAAAAATTDLERQVASLKSLVEAQSAELQQATAAAAGVQRDLVSLSGRVAAECQELRQTIAATRPQLVYDAGSWNTSNVRSWSAPQDHTEGRVKFARKFAAPPKLALSIDTADVCNSANFRVRVYATDVDPYGFTVNVDSWANTKIYSCGVSWIALGE
ncbi:hypothetical protein GGS23DRAFT_166425 [Durotheca rogersii]|uniref:uncharacterized protein n=1 Tax=Durotheca rogersii TaxID=419775 RepID=UPI00221F46D7|nr:uncharacterized protein GGS23DRAFT_166425 [Durotheca rogersii]KAI5867219.1 hypothetical protein GGS23DRAFT_166425 [Durotheca rogersii]